MLIAVENLPVITDYETAEEFVYGKRRDRLMPLIIGKYAPFFIHHASEISRFTIQYYDTEVVAFHPHGQIEINCGEWPTANTARIIDYYLPKGWHASYRWNRAKGKYGRILYRSKENERIEITYNGQVVTTLYADSEAHYWNYDNEGAKSRFSFAVINPAHDGLL